MCGSFLESVSVDRLSISILQKVQGSRIRAGMRHRNRAETGAAAYGDGQI
jgi:hypothetical protein